MRRARRLLMVAAATLACLTAALLQSGPVSAATFGTPVVVSGIDASEPGIDVAADGTLYVNAPDGLLSTPPFSPSLLWRSADGGATWTQTPFGPRATLPGGGDSDVAIAPDGSLAWTDLWLGSATVGRSADGGDTWRVSPLQGTVVQDRQWLANNGGGVVYHATHQLPAGIVVARSIDGGLTYPTQTVAATVPDACVCPSGPVIAEPGTPLIAGRPGTSLTDKVGVIYYNGSRVRFARSTDSGHTWTQSDVLPPSDDLVPGFFPVVANAGGGVLVAVWGQEPAIFVAQPAAAAAALADETGTVGFTISYDWGATWAEPQQIVTAGSSVFPWVDARGTVIGVSLFHTAATGRPNGVDLYAEWHETYLESSTTSPTVWSALQVVDPTPVKTGPICTSGLSCPSGRELGDFQQVAIDSAGRPNLVYARSIDNDSDTEIRFVRGS